MDRSKVMNLLEKLNTLVGNEDSPECAVDSLGLDHEVVVDVDWDDDGKYQNGNIVVKIDGRFFSIEGSRTGSYFTDWYYNINGIAEVKELVTYTIQTQTSYVSLEYSQDTEALIRKAEEMLKELKENK
jgi:hypothetical protein